MWKSQFYGAFAEYDLREAVTTLQETAQTARRVMGGAHPATRAHEDALQVARAALAARETPSASKI